VYGFDEGGLLDDADTPPWDTWVGLMRGEEEYGDVLVSWIPPEFLEHAQHALEQSPDDAVGWLTSYEVPIVAELRARGLLA
jgi:hypothetical protein